MSHLKFRLLTLLLLLQSLQLIPVSAAVCNMCSPLNGLVCISETQFKVCVGDVGPIGQANSCPEGHVCSTATASICVPSGPGVVSDCAPLNDCNKCDSSKTFACTGRRTFALCLGQDTVSNVLGSCEEHQVCNIEHRSICVDTALGVPPSCDLDEVTTKAPTTQMTPTTEEVTSEDTTQAPEDSSSSSSTTESEPSTNSEEESSSSSTTESNPSTKPEDNSSPSTATTEDSSSSSSTTESDHTTNSEEDSSSSSTTESNPSIIPEDNSSPSTVTTESTSTSPTSEESSSSTNGEDVSSSTPITDVTSTPDGENVSSTTTEETSAAETTTASSTSVTEDNGTTLSTITEPEPSPSSTTNEDYSSTTAAPCDNDVTELCKEQDLGGCLPVDPFCRHYVYCFLQDGTWQGSLYTCPGNTYFDSTLRYCSMEKPANCSNQTPPTKDKCIMRRLARFRSMSRSKF